MAYTLKMRELKQKSFRIGDEEYPEVKGEYWRPKTREDCANVPRPCPYVGCPHNTYCDVTGAGSLKINGVPGEQVWERDPETSCVLDIADFNPEGLTLVEVAAILGGITKEAVRRIEVVGGEHIADVKPELIEYL